MSQPILPTGVPKPQSPAQVPPNSEQPGFFHELCSNITHFLNDLIHFRIDSPKFVEHFVSFTKTVTNAIKESLARGAKTIGKSCIFALSTMKSVCTKALNWIKSHASKTTDNERVEEPESIEAAQRLERIKNWLDAQPDFP